MLCAMLLPGFVSVKVNVEVPFKPTELGEKDLTIVGPFGIPQPVKLTLSSHTVAFGLADFLPTARIRKPVVLVPVDDAVADSVLNAAPRVAVASMIFV